MPAFYTQLLDRLRAVPGVAEASLVNCPPLNGGCNGTRIDLTNNPAADISALPAVGVHWATPTWFATMRIPFKQGRMFTLADRVGAPKVVLVTIGAAFPVFTTLASALRHVDPHLVELGRAYGLRRVRLLTTVQLPAVIPALVSGLRLALAQAWLFLVAAELLGSSMGLGFLLIDSSNNGRMDRLFLAIVLLAALGKLTDGIIGVFERWLLRRWG